MRLRSLSNRGIGSPYRQPEPVTLDLDALGQGVIAISGSNGAGKTTLLECFPAALYQRLPYREPRSLYEFASGKDALAEAVFDDNGRTIRATVRIDAERRKSERTLTIDGEEPITGARAYDARVRDLFGSYDAFLATVFAPQSQRRNLCELPVAERKALFAEFIGAGRYARLHEEAKTRRDRLTSEVESERRGILSIEEEVSALPDLTVSHGQAQHAADAASARLDTTRQAEREATDAVARARSVSERLAAVETAELTAKRALDRAVALLTDARSEPDSVRRRHAERLKFIDARTADERCVPLYDAHAEAAKRLDERRARIETQIETLPDAGAIEGILAQVRADLAAAEAEDRAAQVLLRDVDRARADLAAAQKALETARAAAEREASLELAAAQDALDAARKAREREIGCLKAQASIAEKFPCMAAAEWSKPSVTPSEPVDLRGTCPAPEQARTAAEQLAALDAEGPLHEEPRVIAAQAAVDALPGLVLPEEAKVAAAQTDVDALRVRAEAEATAGPARREQHVELRRQETTLAGDLARAEAGPQLHRDLDGIRTERQGVDRKLDTDLAEARQAAEAAAGQVAESQVALDLDLTEAGGKIAAAEAAHATAAATHDEARTAADAVRQETAALDLGVVAVRLTQATADREASEKALRQADQEVARLAAQVDALRAKEAALAPARARIAGLETALGDWRLLSDATGKDGIPQLRIDAAGPEVSGLATEILRTIWGTRFGVSIETQGETLAGKATEEFAIVVHDGAERREVDYLSGGERVVAHEALSLAAAIYVRNKSGIDWRTLIRDEAAGALDHEHARQYVPMLQRARELGGFHQIVIVAHNPEIIAAADAVVEIADGRLTIRGAGVVEEAA